jgi:hypothetical protein
MTDATAAIAKIDHGIATGRGAYLTPDQVQALAALIRRLAGSSNCTTKTAAALCVASDA